MSKAYDIANGMVAHLSAATGFDGIAILVDRQLDIASEIEKRIALNRGSAKGKGAMITVFYNGFQNPDAYGAPVPKVTRTYQVSVYAAPIIAAGHTPADDLVELAAITLHHWEPAETYGISEIHVFNGTARPDDDYLIYDLEVRVQSRL